MPEITSPLSPKSRDNQRKTRPWLIGCLGFTVIVLFTFGVGLYWFFTSGKKVITDEVRGKIVEKIEASGLPFEQQAALKAEIERISDAFKSGDISIKELVMILEEFEQSPVMSVVRYYEVQGDPLARDSISAEERNKAMLTIRRFIYGVFTESIPESAVEDLMEPFILDSSKGEGVEKLKFRENIADEEIFAALDKAEALADEADIPTENLSPDIANEVREIVNRILKRDV